MLPAFIHDEAVGEPAFVEHLSLPHRNSEQKFFASLCFVQININHCRALLKEKI
jgi:hypothetical protein